MEIAKRLKGKIAIVTASTQGIGFAIAERLGLEGASVVVSNAQQRKDLIDKTVEKYGNIDVVVSNAAANPSVDSILQTRDSVLDKLWEINVKATILLLKPSWWYADVVKWCLICFPRYRMQLHTCPTILLLLSFHRSLVITHQLLWLCME
ncbi:peroxisomal 2,4-dienoyl-CoA reductase [Trifolium repens]|nr:peroxisomal 2,4-dienoyl-CoA reductase [Trifolium repens]